MANKGFKACGSGKGAAACGTGKGAKSCACITNTNCPAGLASTYTVSIPSTITFPSSLCNGAAMTPCSPNSAAIVVPNISACNWCTPDTSPASLVFCIGGYTSADSHGLSCVVHIRLQIISGCAFWFVQFFLSNSVLVEYIRAFGGASDTPVGTYALRRIVDSNGGGSNCAGASADATITVSP